MTVVYSTESCLQREREGDRTNVMAPDVLVGPLMDMMGKKRDLNIFEHCFWPVLTVLVYNNSLLKKIWLPYCCSKQ